MSKPVRNVWEPLVVSDVTENVGVKTLTVPTGSQYHVMSLYVKVVASATEGNRQMVVEACDSANAVIDQVRAGAVQAAEATRFYAFHPSGENMSAFIDTDFITTAIPASWVLNAGEYVKVWDNNETDPETGEGDETADDVLVYMRVLSRGV